MGGPGSGRKPSGKGKVIGKGTSFKMIGKKAVSRGALTFPNAKHDDFSFPFTNKSRVKYSIKARMATRKLKRK